MSDLLEKAKALNRSQKFEEAIELLKPELSGDHSEETLAVFCSSLASVSKYEEGVALLTARDQQTQLSAPLIYLLAAMFNKLERYEDALQTLERVPDRQRNHQFARDYAHSVINAVCLNSEKEDLILSALNLLKRLSDKSPKSNLLTFEYGKLLATAGRYEEAGHIFSELIRMIPPASSFYPDLSLAYSGTLTKLGDLPRALSVATRALTLSPGIAALERQKIFIQLQADPLTVNWDDYRVRHEVAPVAGPLEEGICPDWNGEDLRNKKVLLWFEQAYGDQLVFLCSIHLVAERASALTVVVDPRIASLFLSNFPNIEVIALGPAGKISKQELINKQFDYQAYLGDVWALRWKSLTARESFFPVRIPERLVSEFAEITKNISGFRVGISWFTGKSRKRNAKALVDQNRYSLSVSDLEILASVKPVQWFNLQYGDYLEEVGSINSFADCFHSFSDYSANGDFLEYGAQILNVDLVVSMDSTAAVFAACMGKEVWVLCPNDPFWFWMVNEQKNYCSNVSLFIKPWNLPWADFLTLEVVPRLQQRVSEFTNG